MTTTELRAAIETAISRSNSNTEIVHITVSGVDSGDVIQAVTAIHGASADYAMIDREGVDRLDIWGWSDTTPEGEQDWRLAVDFE